VQIFVRTNAYEPGRANIVIYNWDLKDTVEVNVGHVLSLGARYEVRNAQDFFGPAVMTGAYDGLLLQLPMTGLRVAKPIGFESPPPPTGPEFNVFILLPQGSIPPKRPSNLGVLN